jgi:hypothetical protein
MTLARAGQLTLPLLQLTKLLEITVFGLACVPGSSPPILLHVGISGVPSPLEALGLFIKESDGSSRFDMVTPGRLDALLDGDIYGGLVLYTSQYD